MNGNIFHSCDPSKLGEMVVTLLSHSGELLDFYCSPHFNVLYITSNDISKVLDKAYIPMMADWRMM